MTREEFIEMFIEEYHTAGANLIEDVPPSETDVLAEREEYWSLRKLILQIQYRPWELGMEFEEYSALCIKYRRLQDCYEPGGVTDEELAAILTN